MKHSNGKSTNSGMTQDELWLSKYQEVVKFIETNKRNPSKYDDTERGLYCNWIHHNKKLFNAGELKEERVGAFKALLAIIERNKHLNQY